MEHVDNFHSALSEPKIGRNGVHDDKPTKNMITYRRTSLLESPAQTLVNTVNCVGVMGKGLAKAFKDRDPLMFTRYKRVCEERQLEPGRLWLWRGAQNWTLNFPTKDHWRNPSRLEWIEAGLQRFVLTYKEQGIREISFPQLGCGNGNLDWEEVRPLMEHYLSRVDIPVYIHDFTKDIGIPEHLEEISDIAGRNIAQSIEFESFVLTLHEITRLGGSSLQEICSNQSFVATMDSDNCLFLQAEHASWSYDMEDLHGTWVALLRGLVTRERADCSETGGGDFLISLLSMLPTVRPIEIQRGPSAEIAVELLPAIRHVIAAGSTSQQLALGWH